MPGVIVCIFVDSSMSRTFLLGTIFLLGFSSFNSRAVEGNSLTIFVTGLREQAGRLELSLYRTEQDWLQKDRAYQHISIPVQSDSMSVTLADLEYGEYAVSVFHDENDNGKLDMRWLPWPKPQEGAGSSNNIQRNGPPRYDDARFLYSQDATTLTIELRYY